MGYGEDVRSEGEGRVIGQCLAARLSQVGSGRGCFEIAWVLAALNRAPPAWLLDPFPGPSPSEDLGRGEYQRLGAPEVNYREAP